MLESLRGAVRGVTGDQVLYEVRTLEQLAAASLARQRFMMMVLGIFAALAMVLACIGIYGVLAYLTGQRVPEIGLRMALGASAQDVLGMVMRQSGIMILAGVGVGGSDERVAAGVSEASDSRLVLSVLLRNPDQRLLLNFGSAWKFRPSLIFPSTWRLTRGGI